MLTRRYYPEGERGEVRDYLEALRVSAERRKAAVRLDIDLQTLEEFWPQRLNVTVRALHGWEPLLELKRDYDGIAYRIFFFVYRSELWLLSAYEKGSARAPRRELEKAYRRLRAVVQERS